MFILFILLLLQNSHTEKFSLSAHALLKQSDDLLVLLKLLSIAGTCKAREWHSGREEGSTASDPPDPPLPQSTGLGWGPKQGILPGAGAGVSLRWRLPRSTLSSFTSTESSAFFFFRENMAVFCL